MLFVVSVFFHNKHEHKLTYNFQLVKGNKLCQHFWTKVCYSVTWVKVMTLANSVFIGGGIGLLRKEVQGRYSSEVLLRNYFSIDLSVMSF